ncbi:MAG: hypothetical protein FE78DRAFT_91505, partial [Acidomyces sp. 'richmondensis']
AGWVVAAGRSGGGTPAKVLEREQLSFPTYTHTQTVTDRQTDRQTDIDIPDRLVLYHTLMRHALVY